MSDTKTEAKIVEAVMETLREDDPLCGQLDHYDDDADADLRARLSDRVHELVEPYRTSERALRAIVKSLAAQDDRTPVRAEVVFSEKAAAVTVSLPTLTPEREAHFAQSICATIGGVLGLAVGKVKSFGTDAEDAARSAAPGAPQTLAEKVAIIGTSDAVSFNYRGERFVVGVAQITTRRGTMLYAVSNAVFDVAEMTDVRAENYVAALDAARSPAEAVVAKINALGDDPEIEFSYLGHEHRIHVAGITSGGKVWVHRPRTRDGKRSYDASKMTNVRAAKPAQQTFVEKMRILGTSEEVCFTYSGEEYRIRVGDIESTGRLTQVFTARGVEPKLAFNVDLMENVRPAPPGATQERADSGGEAAHDDPKSELFGAAQEARTALIAGSPLAVRGAKLHVLRQNPVVAFTYDGKERLEQVGRVVSVRGVLEMHAPGGSFEVDRMEDVRPGSVIETAATEAFGPRKHRKPYPEIGEKHEFPVLEVVETLHGHATGTGGGLDGETLQKMAEWLNWRVGAGWTESQPVSKTYDELVRAMARTAVTMFRGEKPAETATETLQKLEVILSKRPSIYFDYDGDERLVEDRSVSVVATGVPGSLGWVLRDEVTEEIFELSRVSNLCRTR